jgi:acyl-CoA thioesterase-1
MSSCSPAAMAAIPVTASSAASGRSSRPLGLIVADSLALPRGDVAYEQTWPAMLALRLPAVAWVNRAQRGSTTERLNGEGNGGADCLEFYRPNIAVLQLGICDCAPRVLHRRTASIVYRLPFGVGSRLSAWLEQGRGRKADNCYVALPDYERNVRAYLTRARACGTTVIAIAVAPATRLMLEKNPLVGGQIEAYNAALDGLAHDFANFRVVHPFRGSASVDEMFVDGYHLNERGARRVAAEVESSARAALPRCVAA